MRTLEEIKDKLNVYATIAVAIENEPDIDTAESAMVVGYTSALLWVIHGEEWKMDDKDMKTLARAMYRNAMRQFEKLRAEYPREIDAALQVIEQKKTALE